MKIYIKYEEILENSKSLLEIGNEYNEIITKIETSINNIDKIWISDNKEIEKSNFETINKNLKINKNYFLIFSELIKSINEDFLLTEQQATKYLTLDKKEEVKL